MEGSIVLIVLAQVLGLIAWILLLFSYTKEDIDDLLYLQIFVAFFNVVSYFLLGATAGMLICLIELIKTILYYKTDKDRIIFRCSIVCYLLVGFLTINHWFAILPVIACLIESYGTSINSKTANITAIISNSLWIAYDLIILQYIGAISDAVVVLCNISILIFGYSRILRISKFRINKCNHLSKNIIDKIYELDLKRFKEDNVWDKKYIKDIYKRNNDSLFLIKYKNDFVGYINYLNIKEEEYKRLKRKKIMPEIFDLKSVIKYKQNINNYIVIGSINIKEPYEKIQTIELIEKKIKAFVRYKLNRNINICEILGYGLTDFEKQLYEHIGFKKVKELEDKINLYVLDINSIKDKLY